MINLFFSSSSGKASADIDLGTSGWSWAYLEVADRAALSISDKNSSKTATDPVLGEKGKKEKPKNLNTLYKYRWCVYSV